MLAMPQIFSSLAWGFSEKLDSSAGDIGPTNMSRSHCPETVPTCRERTISKYLDALSIPSIDGLAGSPCTLWTQAVPPGPTAPGPKGPHPGDETKRPTEDFDGRAAQSAHQRPRDRRRQHACGRACAASETATGATSGLVQNGAQTRDAQAA